MGKILTHLPVKLICGFIFKENEILEKAKTILKRKFGNLDFTSDILPFEHTDYYEKEFGQGLKRVFISFSRLIRPEGLFAIKITTNKIEDRLSFQGKRLINIDPGYLDLAKLVLASTKDYKHRIYLNKGIFAEITLFYSGKSFHPWLWTYPDYQTNEYIEIFNAIRGIYERQIK
ncbi:MAG: DUF4416 family protein [Candidatus Omnitrophica bacterium]|nr:DUF4416 family protein [Candidatus Omnitrophota bacterium]